MRALFGNYGRVRRFVMPDNNAIALLGFETKAHAANAFSKLHSFVLRGAPLYLEWAPRGVFATSDSALGKRGTDEFAQTDADADAGGAGGSVYVTNLSFETRGEGLEELIRNKKLPQPKAVKVITRNAKSLGFGFIECRSRADAEETVKALRGTLLDGHLLRLSLAKKKESPGSVAELNRRSRGARASKPLPPSSKLVIRNVAFQASEKELRELVKGVAQLKSLRCPRKVSGELRGFGFAEFADVDAAKKALAFLGNVHFYGRKLVVEFAKKEA